MGYSKGRWEGDTLVVETRGLNGKQWLDHGGHPTTRQAARHRAVPAPGLRPAGDRDHHQRPDYYTKPWTVKQDLALLPDTELFEFICNENEKSTRAHGPEITPASMSTFTRCRPPLAVQWGRGRVRVRRLQAAGQDAGGGRVRRSGCSGGLSARRDQAVAKKNPLRNYVPGKQDVFVMTYAKSGTNWMMHIAHQLIYHGQGQRYDHLHRSACAVARSRHAPGSRS